MAINTTSTHEQQKYILQCLSVRPHSTNELRELGIYFPPARIKELRDKGFHIDTFYRKETDSSGLAHRVGVYVLHQNEVSQNYQYND
ncbi:MULTISPECIES: helix-turn-helix domain-containing protein [Haemophilus]|nr:MULTISPECIES: helix-turn-helix domain-containing protein [Haemophilus]OBX80323.1 transcriptional regulator [Haemophilus aegyptius]OBX82315.1 transcriptional regulator [Haemophilus aegyptius]QEQ59361.1 transcriptional regulator [Haemophilus influenzae biotype aegyptius]QEQ60841.1 transcriptional regulator [Haemophilus influenzae biotype aegyptius]QEQ60853.1 transcriptional regulator [Haemophilus influenzae biotype aegyptius]